MSKHLLEEFYKICGGKETRKPLSKTILDQYKDKVPSEILELWEIGGTGSYMNGFFWVVDPDEYQQILNEIYEIFAHPCVVFGTGCFW